MHTRHNTVVPAAMMTGIVQILAMLRGSLLGRVCEDLQYNYQTVADLTLFILIGMANFACQDGAFVRLKDGTLVPLNGYFWVSGLSNCGKSTLIGRLLEAFHKAEEEAAAESVQARRRYEADRRVRASVERNLMRDVDKAIASGKDPSSVSFMLGLQLPAMATARAMAAPLSGSTMIRARSGSAMVSTPSSISARIARGSSERGLSLVRIAVSARLAAAAPMSGRLAVSRSPPQPSTMVSRPPVTGRRPRRTASTAPGLWE